MFRVFQIAARGGWEKPSGGGLESEILLGENFFTGWREPEKEWFWRFELFSKLKAASFEYWTSIKIKIDITYVSKEYKIKTKMEQEQWLHLKMPFL